MPVTLFLPVVPAPLPTLSCISVAPKQITPVPCPKCPPHLTHPHPLPDLAGEGACEHEGLVKQVQKLQELRISVGKAVSKYNGADDIGSAGVEEEGGVLELS